MSLDIYLKNTVAHKNITHNLGEMAEVLGIYKLLWRPEELFISEARELIEPLKEAIEKMEKYPARYKKHDSENGWGTYENFLPWLKEFLRDCEVNPSAEVVSSR